MYVQHNSPKSCRCEIASSAFAASGSNAAPRNDGKLRWLFYNDVMSPIVITFIALLLLTPLLYVTGSVLVRMRSVKESMEAFERDPSQASFTDKWILGWQLGVQRTVTRWSYNAFGDRFISFYYRLAGYLFLLLALAMWAVFILQALGSLK